MTRAEGIAALAAGMAAAIISLLMLARWLVGRRPHTGTRAITAPRPRPATVPRKDTKGEPPWPPIVGPDPEWLAALAEPKRTPPPPAAPTVAHLLPEPPAHSQDWAGRAGDPADALATAAIAALRPPFMPASAPVNGACAGPVPFDVEFHTSPMLAIAREALKGAGND